MVVWLPTFFTLQGHSRLQVVHLELQTFQGAIGVPGLPLVCNQHRNDDQQKQAATSTDSDDGRKRQQAVWVDVKSARGVLKPTSTDLKTHTAYFQWKHTKEKNVSFPFTDCHQKVAWSEVFCFLFLLNCSRKKMAHLDSPKPGIEKESNHCLPRNVQQNRKGGLKRLTVCDGLI